MEGSPALKRVGGSKRTFGKRNRTVAVRPAAGGRGEADPGERHPLQGGTPGDPVERRRRAGPTGENLAPSTSILRASAYQNARRRRSRRIDAFAARRAPSTALRAASRTRRFGSFAGELFDRPAGSPGRAGARGPSAPLTIATSTCSLEICAWRASAARSIIDRSTGRPERVAELRERDRRVPAHVGDADPRRAPGGAGSRAGSPSCAEDVGGHLAHAGVLGLGRREHGVERRPGRRSSRAPRPRRAACPDPPPRRPEQRGHGRASRRGGRARGRGSAAPGRRPAACARGPRRPAGSRPRAPRAPPGGRLRPSERESSKAACQRRLAAPPRTSWR